MGRGQGHTQGDSSASARLIVRAPHQGDHAVFWTRRVSDAHAPAESRSNQLSTQADAEDPHVRAHATAHELALGFQPRPRLIVVGVRSATQQDEGTRQGSGGQVAEALRSSQARTTS